MQLIQFIRELYMFRELLLTLTKREIKVRYKQTFLGASWAIFQPLSLMLIFTLIFSFVLKVETVEAPYPIFSYSALLVWTFFSTSLTFGSISLLNNANLVTKVYFPREILPFSSIGAALVDLAVGFILFVGMMVYFHSNFSLNIIWIIPILAIGTIFTASLVLFSSALIIVWRDLKFIIPLILQIWIFAVPVIYPITRVPDKIRLFYTLDPIVPVINNFRRVTIMGEPPLFGELCLSFLISSVLFILSYLYFKHKERIFADII